MPKEPNETETEMSPEEAREKGIALMLEYFVQGLKMVGVESLAVGISTDDSPKGAGFVKMLGNATAVLNLVACLVQRMPPEDFRRLCESMVSGPIFAEQRAALAPQSKHGPN